MQEQLSRLLALVVLSGSIAAAPSSGVESSQTESEIRWQDFTGEANDGSELKGRLGRLHVPENRAKRDGPTIDLAFVHFKSTNPEPGPPIFYLIGGPGAPANEFTANEATIPELRLLEFGDVIGIDQRGTGKTVPNLYDDRFSSRMPFDRAITRADRVEVQRQAVADCYKHWTEQGVDLSAYNTVESADDMEAVREALGYDKITLWATSYGSHLGLAYLRRHAEHVERAVLMKVEGPDHTYKLPSAVQKQYELIAQAVAADEKLAEHMPDMLETTRTLLETLRAKPVEVTLVHPGGEAKVVVGPHDLQCALAMHVGHTQSMAHLPMFLHSMAQGDWQMLGMASMNLRSAGVESGMALMMDASSGASQKRLARIERERDDEQNLVGDALNFNLYPEVSDACGSPDLGAKFRGKLRCKVPVLFVSGDLDGRTPPSNVEEIVGGFSKAAHILVKGTGHDSRELISAEYCELVRGFLSGAEVESTEIQLPPVEFFPIQAR